VAKVESSDATGSVLGKKTAAICAAKRPKIRKSKSSTKLPTAQETIARRRIRAYSAGAMPAPAKSKAASDILAPQGSSSQDGDFFPRQTPAV
jgi:hypothetical protein